jgi:hypothetical protein
MNFTQAKEWENYVKANCPIAGGSFFATVKLVTEVDTLKSVDGKRGKLAVENPFTGRLKKHTVIRGDATFGPTQFRTYVVNRRKKAGYSPDEAEQVEVSKPSGRHHIDGYDGITQSDSIEDRYYASLYFLRDDLRMEVWYELDGHRIAKPEQDGFWTRFLKSGVWRPYDVSTKHGVESPHTVTPMLESITVVKCGGFTVGNEAELVAPVLIEGGEFRPAAVAAAAIAEVAANAAAANA